MARTFWSGHISFGLVTIPIRLATAIREKNIHFHMLSPDGSCRLRRKLYCPETGKEFEFNETARGYEIAPNQYVLLRDDELDRLRPEAGRTIEIAQFAHLKEIDPIYFSSTYYIVPDESGARAYRLLLKAMADSQRVAIARFVMRQKQHLAALRVRGDAILLHTMHYADEIVPAQEVVPHAPDTAKLPAKELDMAQRLVEALTEKFDPTAFRDEYREQVEQLIEKKAEGQEIVAPAVEEDEPPRTINLMEALQKSLKQVRKPEKKPPARKQRKSA